MTGELGRIVIQELLKRVPAGQIVASVRSPDHDIAKQFTTQGAEIRVADYTRPDTVSAAFESINRLLLISSSQTGDCTVEHDCQARR